MSRASLPPLEDDFARALLGSAQADAPSPSAYAKVAAALGVGVGLGVGAALPVAAVGTAGVAHITRWSSSLSAKLVLFGVSGTLLGAGVLALRSPEPVKPQAQAAAEARRQLAAEVSAQALSAPVARSAESPRALTAPSRAALPAASGALGGAAALVSPAAKASLPSVPAAPAARPGSARRGAHAVSAPGAHAVSAPGPARASSDSSLAEQVQSLDSARVALAAGDAASALAEIARYRAAWPNGVFLTEASVLEIEALAARGEKGRAATRAADFVAAHPDSPQADRLRTLSRHAKP